MDTNNNCTKNTTLTKKLVKFFLPVPAILALIVYSILIIKGRIYGISVSGFRDWVNPMVIFYLFIVLPFDIVWAIFKKIGKFIISCVSGSENKGSAEISESASSSDAQEEITNLEHCLGIKQKKLTMIVEKILLYQDKPSQQMQKTSQEAFIQKMKKLNTETVLDSDDQSSSQLPEKYFEDAAHMFYTQYFLYDKNPSIGMIQRQFNLTFAEAYSTMSELCEAKIVELTEQGKYKLLINTERQLTELINHYCNLLFRATPEEAKIIKSKIKWQSEQEVAKNTNIVSPTDILIRVDGMDGHSFERFCAELLKNNGFENVRVTPGSGDQGIDVLATKDYIDYGIQCKCYSSDVGNKAVQEAIAGRGFYDCHVGAVLTNQFFTQSACELAKKEKILLWNRSELKRLIENQLNEK